MGFESARRAEIAALRQGIHAAGAATEQDASSCPVMGVVSPLFYIAPLSWLAAIAASLLAAPLLASTGPDILGNWLRTDGTARIRIASCGAQICAVNTWIKDTIRDERVGDQIVMTLEPRGDSNLSGAAFDVRRNRSYSIDITIDRNSMQTHGCLIKGIVCKTMSWNRTP